MSCLDLLTALVVTRLAHRTPQKIHVTRAHFASIVNIFLVIKQASTYSGYTGRRHQRHISQQSHGCNSGSKHYRCRQLRRETISCNAHLPFDLQQFRSYQVLLYFVPKLS
jgi:hypothetical protein